METARVKNWNLENDRVIVVPGKWAESTALKHYMYICQNERTFQPSRYIAFVNEGTIRYLFELVDTPYNHCNLDNTPILRTIEDLENPNEPREVMYLRKVADVGPIENDQLDKNGNLIPFTQGMQRYTTYDRIFKAQRTSELVD
jgi:hypothetical protein